jgi:hypothetical protein
LDDKVKAYPPGSVIVLPGGLQWNESDTLTLLRKAANDFKARSFESFDKGRVVAVWPVSAKATDCGPRKQL